MRRHGNDIHRHVPGPAPSAARVGLAVLVCWLTLARPGRAAGDDFENPKANTPPKAAPQRQNAAEGFPPLPLPATPLRRSEKKREPSAPALVGSVTFSEAAQKAGGFRWGTTIVDIEQWVNFTNANLGQRYRFVGTDFGSFSYDPAELPILYFTGWKALPRLDDATVEKLRRYLAAGGTWVVHSNCGRPAFNESFRREVRRVFPDRQLAPVPADHPVYASFHKIDSMKVRKDRDPWRTVPTTAGLLETVNLGTRAAVLFSPIDLSCGWDANANPIDGGVLYDQQDALRLGVNITTYCLAEYQYARAFDHAKVYHQADLPTGDALVLGQVVHNGDWDATPHGLPNLLKAIDASTTLKVRFKRVPVDPETADVFAFPVLYLSGQRAAFALSPDARKRLREYLDRGGVLIADNVAGGGEFDAAFRKEMREVYNDRELRPLPPSHPVYTFVNDCAKVRLAPLAAQLFGDPAAPQLEAVQVDGTLPVIYSKLSLGAGWEGLPRAYNRGYADADAIRLGVNVFTYAVAY